mgnify:CR=1 FL=1
MMESKESKESMENVEEAQAVQDARAVIERIERVFTEREHVFVAIDGPCASGKTTLAALLQRRFDGNVLHMDDFSCARNNALRNVRRTGSNVDRERFEEEVLAPLVAGNIVQYRPWDCHTGDFAASHSVEPARLTIVEGSYSMHPALREYYDLMICLMIDSNEQLRRLEARNPRMLQRFIDEWIPLENRYFEQTGTRAIANMVVDTAKSNE